MTKDDGVVVHGSGLVARQPIAKNAVINDPTAVFFASAIPDATEDGRENYIRVSNGYFKIHAFARDRVCACVRVRSRRCTRVLVRMRTLLVCVSVSVYRYAQQAVS